MSNQVPRILVLDSDPEFLTQLEHLLEGEGFNTTVTWDVWEAIALLASRTFDLLLVGEHSPEVKAADILMRLHAMPTPLPCIILQAVERHPFEAQYLSWFGAYAVIARRRHKAIVEQLRQAVRHSPSTCLESTAAS
jgi:CheY-like chemotaxis protein